MTEIYYLNGDTLPTIPTPHDCVIDKVDIDEEYVVFTFEQYINYHDSIQAIKPNAKSLVMKFHLADSCLDIYERRKPNRIFAKNGYYRAIDTAAFLKIAESDCKLEYLYHYVAYQSLIVELCAKTTIRLELTTDRVEFYWT